nr:MAG TPA: hypothetical protein [Caudoviricetes sp.]
MKKITNKTTEEKTTKKSLLQPFPFIENDKYLLKLKSGEYIAARWTQGKFVLDYELNCSDDFIEEEIESIVSLKELGL